MCRFKFLNNPFKSLTWINIILCFQHMYRHGWKRPFNCDLCNYSTINKSNLVNHINIKHEKPDSRDYSCPQCDKQYKSSNNLNAHMKTHEDILLKCEFCAKTFKSDLGLSQHRFVNCLLQYIGSKNIRGEYFSKFKFKLE